MFECAVAMVCNSTCTAVVTQLGLRSVLDLTAESGPNLFQRILRIRKHSFELDPEPSPQCSAQLLKPFALVCIHRLTRLVADASLPAPIIPDRLFAAIAQPRWCSLSAALHYMGTR